MRAAVLAPRPGVTVLVGALAIAFSAILFRLAAVSPSTGAFFRCLWALPALWLVARWEERRWGRRTPRARAYAAAAGLFFSADLILWHTAIEHVGAGLATVLGNTQVVLVAVVAWLVLGETPRRSSLAAIPVVAAGVVLVSGVLEQGAYGQNPGLGAIYGIATGLAYTGFLLVLRHGQAGVVGPAGPLFDATLVCAAASAVAGAAMGDLDLTPPLAATGWLVLLALLAQVLGWLLIAVSLPRLPAVAVSISLTVQPVGSVAFAALILGERPSPLQLGGAAVILCGLAISSLGRRRPVAEPELAG